MWYGKKVVLGVFSCIIILLGAGAYTFFKAKTVELIATEPRKTQVTLKKVSDMSAPNSFSTVGVVQAVSEATLQTEAGGRITSVTTEIGKAVRTGSVLATIENNAERAVLLQAEGAYEAAVAGARTGEVGVAGAQINLASAQTSVVNVYQTAYITVDDVLHNTLSEYFTISNGLATNFELNGKGTSQQLITELNALEDLFTKWTIKNDSLTNTTIAPALDSTYTNTLRLAQFVEKLTILAQDQDISPSYTQSTNDADVATFFATRVTVNNLLTQIEATRMNISSAEKTLQQALIAGASNTPSVATAQVKIALGSLRAAQANYEKTLVRTPISGIVNALYLKEGAYVSPSQPAAVVANNNRLQVITSVSEEDASLLSIGDTVSVNGIKTGTIAALGGAIDPAIGKVNVKISIDDTSDISNGSTVTIVFVESSQMVSEFVTIPLSAIKMTGSGPIAFKVEENKLASIPLTLGEISGDFAVIKTGLSFDSQIVVDARGLKEGAEVEVTTN